MAFNTLRAQNLDSLLNELPQKKADTSKTILLEKIIYNYIFKDKQKMLRYTDSLLVLSKKIKYPTGEASAYGYYAEYYEWKQEWNTARTFVNKADSIYQVTNDTLGLAYVATNRGNQYRREGKYEEALKQYHIALDYYEKENKTDGQAVTLGTIAMLFLNMERYDEAENYYLKSFEIRKKIGDKRGMCMVLINLGVIYNEKENYDKALACFNLCLQIQKEFNDPVIISTCKMNIGNIYMIRKKYQDALNIFDECYRQYTEMEDTVNMSNVLMFEAIAYREKGNPEKSLSLLNEGLDYIHDIPNMDLRLATYYMELYHTYRALRDYENALYSYEKAIEYKAGILSSETADKISELKEKYETEKKEQENVALKRETEIKDLKIRQQNNTLYAAIAVIILIIIIFAQLIYYNKMKSVQQNALLEQRLLRSQMNPHFIFNALIAIQSFVFKNEPRRAGKFLSSFAQLVRSILENSRDEYITLSKEIIWLENYIELQKLRFDNVFEYFIRIDPTIDRENILIPPMLTQPFIENALEHGLGKMEEKGVLEVTFVINGNMLQITVSDNGAGFNQSEKTGDHESLAIRITEDRLKLVNKGKNKKIIFNIFSSPGKGTTVSFAIPLKKRL